ncbi:uncharacterized protein LOC100376816 [Saccoglossus kowalevskii]|uniref:Uncharacterized protein LOC100376816 n=1 Tax=Saccoglossus kowalevskii TaxID=10224 RepID=A0ABM0GP70_SACKO|nr:PREDICTED: uncharacterized protein LOC100376816 [Saccoglossus kowalevskii]
MSALRTFYEKFQLSRCLCNDENRCSCNERASRAGKMASYCLIVLGVLVTGPGILMASSGHSGNLHPTYAGVGFLSFGGIMVVMGLILCGVNRLRKRHCRNPHDATTFNQQEFCVVTEDPDGFEDYVQRRGLPHSESMPASAAAPSTDQGVIRCYVLPTSVSWPNTSRAQMNGPVVYYVGRPLPPQRQSSSSSNNTT